MNGHTQTDELSENTQNERDRTNPYQSPNDVTSSDDANVDSGRSGWGISVTLLLFSPIIYGIILVIVVYLPQLAAAIAAL